MKFINWLLEMMELLWGIIKTVITVVMNTLLKPIDIFITNFITSLIESFEIVIDQEKNQPGSGDIELINKAIFGIAYQPLKIIFDLMNIFSKIAAPFYNQIKNIEDKISEVFINGLGFILSMSEREDQPTIPPLTIYNYIMIKTGGPTNEDFIALLSLIITIMLLIFIQWGFALPFSLGLPTGTPYASGVGGGKLIKVTYIPQNEAFSVIVDTICQLLAIAILSKMSSLLSAIVAFAFCLIGQLEGYLSFPGIILKYGPEIGGIICICIFALNVGALFYAFDQLIKRK